LRVWVEHPLNGVQRTQFYEKTFVNSPSHPAGAGRPPFDCIALLLQGGGALGAYQGGVYEALAERGLHPDWVAGISIGAINAALIAGAAPPDRVRMLRTFWETVTPPRFAVLGRRCRTRLGHGQSLR
jgi:NTE family protein